MGDIEWIAQGCFDYTLARHVSTSAVYTGGESYCRKEGLVKTVELLPVVCDAYDSVVSIKWFVSFTYVACNLMLQQLQIVYASK